MSQQEDNTGDSGTDGITDSVQGSAADSPLIGEIKEQMREVISRLGYNTDGQPNLTLRDGSVVDCLGMRRSGDNQVGVAIAVPAIELNAKMVELIMGGVAYVEVPGDTTIEWVLLPHFGRGSLVKTLLQGANQQSTTSWATVDPLHLISRNRIRELAASEDDPVKPPGPDDSWDQTMSRLPGSIDIDGLTTIRRHDVPTDVITLPGDS